MEGARSVHKRRRGSFRHDERTNVENRRAHPLLLMNCRRKVIGNIFERKVSQRPESVWEERSKTLQTVHQCEMHDTVVILGTPPCVY